MSDKFYLEDFAEATIAQKGTPAEKAELQGRLTQKAELQDKKLNDLWYRLTTLKIEDSKRLADISKFIADERVSRGGNAGAEFEAHAAVLEKYGLLTKSITKEASNSQGVLKADVSNSQTGTPVSKSSQPGIDERTRIRAAESVKGLTPQAESNKSNVEFRAIAYN